MPLRRGGMWVKNSSNASSPPADAPMPTTGKPFSSCGPERRVLWLRDVGRRILLAGDWGGVHWFSGLWRIVYQEVLFIAHVFPSAFPVESECDRLDPRPAGRKQPAVRCCARHTDWTS